MAEKTPEQIAADFEAAAQAAKKAKAKYRVLRPVEHDGKLYPVESVITLTGEQAEPLIAHRAIEVAMKEVPLT